MPVKKPAKSSTGFVQRWECKRASRTTYLKYSEGSTGGLRFGSSSGFGSVSGAVSGLASGLGASFFSSCLGGNFSSGSRIRTCSGEVSLNWGLTLVKGHHARQGEALPIIKIGRLSLWKEIQVTLESHEVKLRLFEIHKVCP